jgi:hypothetical protein
MRRRTFLTGVLAFATPALASAQTTGQSPAPATRNTVPQARGLVEPIVPENALERTFLAAFSNEDMRAAFRRQFLESPVVLAVASNAPDAPPLERPLPNNARATFVFTSLARADAVMGPAAPRRVMNGREALERLRGKYLIVNYQLEPMLTLEPEDLERFLAIPQTSPRSAGPSQ